VFDAHTDAEFKTEDIEATMATLGDAPHLTHVPTLAGGTGREEVRPF
jgi:carboxymethylenebutenolidase